jgi:hypothetical protein
MHIYTDVCDISTYKFQLCSTAPVALQLSASDRKRNVQGGAEVAVPLLTYRVPLCNAELVFGNTVSICGTRHTMPFRPLCRILVAVMLFYTV